MLRWDEVRRLIVRHVAPAVRPLGFGEPGRTMRRWRNDFVDVIDFRCGKRGDRAVLTFGCGLRRFVGQNPKPRECMFSVQPDLARPEDLLEFKASADEQVAAMEAFAPLFAVEAQRWFGLLTDVRAARDAIDRNTWTGPNHVAVFAVPSPAYDDAVRMLEAVLAAGPAGK